MRFSFHDGLGTLRRGLMAFGVLAITAGGASAQLLFDGNIVFQNNASGTLAGQFTGTAPNSGSCTGLGLTAAILFGTNYPNNTYADPLLTAAINQPNVVPDFKPGAGSPAFGNAVTLPNDGFFQQVCYKGAIGPNVGDDWTLGWTYYDSTGANRNDLHLVGMPEPRPLAVYHNVHIRGHRTFSPDSNYEVRGQLRIRSQASLSVSPGVVILEDVATIGTIIVERGAAFHAIGTKERPIIITSNAAPGSQTRGDIGGISFLGRGKTNVVNSCAGDSSASEGGAVGFYGGNDDLEGSGHLRYVRVEYAGREITANNELNAFTFNTCGRSMRADYLQSFRGADDGFEWFGGEMYVTHLLAVDGTDDGYDTQLGARTKGQFIIVRVDPSQAPSLSQFGERAIEADNNEFSHDQAQCAGRSFSQVANATFIGDKRTGATFPGSTQGIELRRGTSFSVYNSIVYNFKSHAVRVSDDATWLAHCSAPPSAPPIFCTTVGVLPPIDSGNLFVARSAPNPFRNQVSFAFTLPQAGPVSVEIFSADGRHVTTLAQGEMGAGQHNLTWTLDRETPAGMYFYRVLAGNQQATGKITRVN